MRWPWQRRKAGTRRELRAVSAPVLLGDGTSVEHRPDEAMRLATVYGCVDRISSTISTLPVHFYEESTAGKKVIRDHPTARLLQIAPNEFQTPSEFFGYLLRCVLLRGDAFAAIYRHDATGEIIRLLPIEPDRVVVRLHPSRRRLVYVVDGQPMPADAVWHVRGLPDGNFLRGCSAIRAAAKVIDAGRASVNLQHAVADNAAQPRDIFETDGTLDADEADAFLADWKAKTSGAQAGGAYVLPVGLKHKQLTISLEDKQFIESRRLTAEEIAGLFGMPLFMVFGQPTTWTEEVQTYFAQIVLRPWVVRLEQSFARDCLLRSEQGRFYIRFAMEGLMRASLATRTDAYEKQMRSGILSPNEARELEDRPPRPGGDMYFAPLNLAHIDGATGRVVYNGPQNPIPTEGSNAEGPEA